MPQKLQVCPACHTPSLKCTETRPDEVYMGHSLQAPRRSLWLCRSCGARFVLDTPEGHLTRIRDTVKYPHR